MRHWRYSGEPARGAVLAEIIWSLPLFLSLLKERLETLPLVLVDVVHLTGKPRIGKVEVDFGNSRRSVPPVAADLIEVQTIVHQVGQHQMPQLVRGQLRQAQCLSDLIKDLGDRPLADGLTSVLIRFGEKE